MHGRGLLSSGRFHSSPCTAICTASGMPRTTVALAARQLLTMLAHACSESRPLTRMDHSSCRRYSIRRRPAGLASHCMGQGSQGQVSGLKQWRG